MMFLGMFRGGLQKMVKKGSKFVPPGPKNIEFSPFLAIFTVFGLKNYSSELIFLIIFLYDVSGHI